jgi:hypothetical protein
LLFVILIANMPRPKQATTKKGEKNPSGYGTDDDTEDVGVRESTTPTTRQSASEGQPSTSNPRQSKDEPPKKKSAAGKGKAAEGSAASDSSQLAANAERLRKQLAEAEEQAKLAAEREEFERRCAEAAKKKEEESVRRAAKRKREGALAAAGGAATPLRSSSTSEGRTLDTAHMGEVIRRLQNIETVVEKTAAALEKHMKDFASFERNVQNFMLNSKFSDEAERWKL